MIRTNKLFARFTLLFSVVFCVASCSASSAANAFSKNDNVIVALHYGDDHVRTGSTNPQTVKKGSKAYFHLSFDEKYEFSYATEGRYDVNGSFLAVDTSSGNKTVQVFSQLAGEYKIRIENNSAFGDVSISPNKQSFEKGEIVTVTTTSKNKEFLCYTIDSPYRVGARMRAGVPVSYDSSYSIAVAGDMKIVVNYFETDGKIIDYDLNGGVTASGNTTIHTDYKAYNAKDYLYPNSINLSQYAFRDGYVLESLNTEQNGEGERIGVGSRIANDLFQDNAVTLYAQWIKASDEALFDYTVNDLGEVEISSYSGNEQTIVVPKTLDEKRVTTIKTGAFANVAETKKVVLPDTIKTIENRAFSSMPNVETLVAYSSIESASKLSFDMPNLKTIQLNSNTNPLTMGTGEDNLSRYREAILNLDKSKSNVIFIGHSTIRINHDFTPFGERWGDKYNFFIYGASASMSGYMLFNSILDIFRPQDYVIFPVWSACKNDITSSRNFAFLQYDFDCIENCDYQIMKNYFWESLVAYREQTTDQLGVDAIMSEATNYPRWDKYGMNKEDTPTDDVNNGPNRDYSHYLDSLQASDFSFLHDFAEDTPFPDDHIMPTWNAYNANCIFDTDPYLAYENRIKEEFPTFTFFDSQLDNINPGNHFNTNDFTHLSTIGGTARVNRWLGQIVLP